MKDSPRPVSMLAPEARQGSNTQRHSKWVVLWSLLSALCVTLPLSAAQAEAVTPLVFGVLPYKAPQRLAADLAPLIDFLKQTTGRPVAVQTAKDYPTLIESTRRGDYDILLTAPHFARLAQTESHYQPIAMTGYQVQAVVLAPKNSSIRTLADLRGHTLAMPPREALVHYLTLELLRAQGLEPGRTVTLREFINNQLSMAAPLRGDTDASATGMLLWQTSGQKDELRALAESKQLPGIILMAHPRLSPESVQRLRKDILDFAKTPAGQAYLAASGHESWLPVPPNVMPSLDPYVHFLKD